MGTPSRRPSSLPSRFHRTMLFPKCVHSCVMGGSLPFPPLPIHHSPQAARCAPMRAQHWKELSQVQQADGKKGVGARLPHAVQRYTYESRSKKHEKIAKIV